MLGRKKFNYDEERMLSELRTVSKQLAEVTGRLDAAETELGLSDQVVKLKKQVAELEIKRDKELEDRNREKREVEHMVGLARQRSEQEAELAVKQAEIKVREENMKAKEDMFEERMQKVTAQLNDQIEYLRTDILRPVLERLPNVNVNLNRDFDQPRRKALDAGAEED